MSTKPSRSRPLVRRAARAPRALPPYMATSAEQQRGGARARKSAAGAHAAGVRRAATRRCAPRLENDAGQKGEVAERCAAHQPPHTRPRAQ